MTVATAAPSRSAWSARGWAIYLGWIVVTLDTSGLNLALPTIGVQLRAEAGGVSWVVDAYTLPLASLLLLGGSLGDRIGAERLYRIGTLGFAGAAIACAISPSFGVLITFRAVQGVFAALALPMMFALVGTSFRDSRQRTRAVNLMTVFGGAGMAIGPFLGGLLTDTVGWQAVFWLTAPLAIGAAILTTNSEGTRPRRQRLRLDLFGQATGTAGLVALVAGLIEAGGETGALVPWTLMTSGLLLLGCFVVVEHRSPDPMMPLSVFRSAGFAGAVVGGFAFQFGAYGLQFFLALYIQSVWGISALTGGLLLASFAVGVVIAGAAINPRIQRYGTRPMVLSGGLIGTFGTLLLLGVSGAPQWWLLVVADFIVGIGTGMYSTALNGIASTSLGPEAAGLGSGIYNTSRQIGQAIGIAVLGTLATAHGTASAHPTAIAIVTGCAVLITFTAIPRPRKRVPDAACGTASLER